MFQLHNGACRECGGTGSRDSGGTQPWGEAIEVPCDCVPELALMGPFQVDQWTNGKVVIQAHHGDHDVALVVDGNFADHGAKVEYAKALCHELCQVTRAFSKQISDMRSLPKPKAETSPISGFFGEYRWLSNFHPSMITIADITYPTAEHAYQAMKTTDRALRLRIASMPTPVEAKAAGRTLVALRHEWDTGRNIRLEAMRLVVKKKFQDPELARKLLDTGDRHLYETNAWGDRYWGRIFVKKSGIFYGENHLGRILMAQRDELRRKSAKD